MVQGTARVYSRRGVYKITGKMHLGELGLCTCRGLVPGTTGFFANALGRKSAGRGVMFIPLWDTYSANKAENAT